MPRILVRHLGQSGFRLEIGRTVIYIDPYLSDSVEKSEGVPFRRLRPAPMAPVEITDASAVLISHIHGDHCDLETLVPLSGASPDCRFYGPREVIRALVGAGVDPGRTVVMNADAISIDDEVSIHPIPAAHKNIEVDVYGCLRYLGYVFICGGKKLLHTGDSCVHELLLSKLRALGKIDVAFLPVNECNFFRDRAGIVGNMSIRDAFSLANLIGADRVVPMHYDMFSLNQVYREEMQVVYDYMKPSFLLDFDPQEI